MRDLYAILQVLGAALLVAGFGVWFGVIGALLAGGFVLLVGATLAEFVSIEAVDEPIEMDGE